MLTNNENNENDYFLDKKKKHLKFILLLAKTLYNWGISQLMTNSLVQDHILIHLYLRYIQLILI